MGLEGERLIRMNVIRMDERELRFHASEKVRGADG